MTNPETMSVRIPEVSPLLHLSAVDPTVVALASIGQKRTEQDHQLHSGLWDALCPPISVESMRYLGSFVGEAAARDSSAKREVVRVEAQRRLANHLGKAAIYHHDMTTLLSARKLLSHLDPMSPVRAKVTRATLRIRQAANFLNPF